MHTIQVNTGYSKIPVMWPETGREGGTRTNPKKIVGNEFDRMVLNDEIQRGTGCWEIIRYMM